MSENQKQQKIENKVTSNNLIQKQRLSEFVGPTLNKPGTVCFSKVTRYFDDDSEPRVRDLPRHLETLPLASSHVSNRPNTNISYAGYTYGDTASHYRFGENSEPHCTGCDVCQAPAAIEAFALQRSLRIQLRHLKQEKERIERLIRQLVSRVVQASKDLQRACAHPTTFTLEAYEHAKFENTYRCGICYKELTPAEIRKAIENATAAAERERRD